MRFAVLCLIARPLFALSPRGLSASQLSGQEDVDLVPALGTLHFPDRPIPSLSEVSGSDSMLDQPGRPSQMQLAARALRNTMLPPQLEQEASRTTEQLDLAAERIAEEQRMASAQLEQTRLAASKFLEGSSQGPSTQSQYQLGTSPELLVGADGTAIGHSSEQGVALSQTSAQLGRHKNPALAALLLESVWYGCTLITWGLITLVTGVSSAFCLYIGIKFPGYMPNLLDSGCKRAVSSTSSYFQYPGAPSLQRQVCMAGSESENEPEEDAENVETWVKTPMLPQVSRVDGCAVARDHGERCPGYLDDAV